jgi:hypothetical protein
MVRTYTDQVPDQRHGFPLAEVRHAVDAIQRTTHPAWGETTQTQHSCYHSILIPQNPHYHNILITTTSSSPQHPHHHNILITTTSSSPQHSPPPLTYVTRFRKLDAIVTRFRKLDASHDFTGELFEL